MDSFITAHGQIPLSYDDYKVSPAKTLDGYGRRT
jgi:hypothetical protein